ncbi:MAG: hypothetical protein ACLTWR_07910 [Agathobaculum desmolans]
MGRNTGSAVWGRSAGLRQPVRLRLPLFSPPRTVLRQSNLRIAQSELNLFVQTLQSASLSPQIRTQNDENAKKRK